MNAAQRLVVPLVASIAWGLVVAVGAYAIVRAVQFFLYPDPNPATLVWSAHAGYFWRAWTVAYAGGIAAFVAFPLVRRQPEAALRALAPAIAVASTLLLLQAVFLP
jgi:hypothetical protein